MGRATVFGLSVVSALGSIAIWYVVTTGTGLLTSLQMPGPQNVLKTFLHFSGTPYLGATLWGHAAASLKIVFGGWLLGAAVGIPLGILLGWSRWANRLVSPIFQLLRPLPPLAWIPLAIVWFGIGDPARIYVVFLAAVVPWTINATEAVESVDPLLVNAARNLAASNLRTLWSIVIPAQLPLFVAAARIALGNAWTTLVAAELLAANVGLGFVALNSARTLDSDILIVSMGMIGVLGAAFSLLMRALARVVAPWNEAS